MDKKECKKVKFSTEKDAEFYLSKLKKTSSRKNIPTRAYLCPFCTSWHLTSRDSFENKKIKELESEIESLKKEISKKNEEINLLEGRNNKEYNLAIKTDERIIKLNEKIAQKDKDISRLRTDNSELITKLCKLTKTTE